MMWRPRGLPPPKPLRLPLLTWPGTGRRPRTGFSTSPLHARNNTSRHARRSEKNGVLVCGWMRAYTGATSLAAHLDERSIWVFGCTGRSGVKLRRYTRQLALAIRAIWVR